MEDMIPGLTDDVERECLARVPYNAFPTLFSVCKRWRQVLRDPTFHRFRKSTGIAQPVVVLVQPFFTYSTWPEHTVYRLVIFEPVTGVWSSLPPCPNFIYGLPHLCRLAAVGTELVVVGGRRIDTCLRSNGVHVYDFVSGEWRHGSSLPSPLRLAFACAATHDSDKGCRTVYVAGGHDASRRALRSALAYDVAGDSWKPLPDMVSEPFNCRGVILRGKFLVLDRHCAEAFDAATGSWGPVEEFVPQGEEFPAMCIAGWDGSIYRCAGREVMVQLDGGVWASVAELPGEMRVALHAVAWEGKLVVMGLGTRKGALVANILDIKAITTMTTPASAAWTNVEVPPEYQRSALQLCFGSITMVTTLWESSPGCDFLLGSKSLALPHKTMYSPLITATAPTKLQEKKHVVCFGMKKDDTRFGIHSEAVKPYLPRWSCSCSSIIAKIVVMTVESGLNSAEKSGPLTDMHHDCR
ncbi:hypothetical protein GW17_00028481 [Ensete ventricosum]|nr:hypothetical protein GW17_00028481 [Ensete ventricosum]